MTRCLKNIQMMMARGHLYSILEVNRDDVVKNFGGLEGAWKTPEITETDSTFPHLENTQNKLTEEWITRGLMFDKWVEKGTTERE